MRVSDMYDQTALHECLDKKERTEMGTEEAFPERELTKGQGFALGALAAIMLGVGIVGAIGTFSNSSRAFPDDAGTALGVVAGGEGTTLTLALTQIALTLLGQSIPLMVRIGLWALPAAAAVTGVVMATSPMEAVVYAVTPMAMCVSAEGLGLVARRVVIYRTRVDMEARRRTAKATHAVAFQRAVAANHPDKKVQKKALRKSWKLAEKMGVDDEQLGLGLVDVQRVRLTEGANSALEQMLTVTPVTPPAVAAVTERDGRDAGSVTAVTDSSSGRAALTAGDTHITDVVTERADRHDGPVTAVTGEAVAGMPHPAPGEPLDDQPGTDDETEASRESGTVTLADLASVAGVPTPVPGEPMDDTQLKCVLRHFRYREDPPASYRKAHLAFRKAKFVGSEERVRKIWNELDAEAKGAAVSVPDDEDDDVEEPKTQS